MSSSQRARPLYTFRPLNISSDDTAKHLPPKSREVRLLSFDRSSSSDQISLHLQHADLNTVANEYIAVSYTWGPSAPTHRVSVDGAELLIRDNIFRFLRHVIKVGLLADTKFWIDSICINQNDLGEKAQQVAMMAEIFGYAHHVVLWLGEASENACLSEYAAEHQYCLDEPEWNRFLKRTAQEKSYRHSLDVEDHLAMIIGNEYWTRLWIVQEMQLARDLVIVMGNMQLSFRELSQILTFCQNHWFGGGFGALKGHRSDIPKVNIEAAISLFNLVLTRTRTDPDQRSASQSFLNLLPSYDNQKCSNPRDKVYGLLSLTPYTDQDFHIDYKCSLEALFVRLVHCMQQEVTKISDSRYCTVPCVPMGDTLSAMATLGFDRLQAQSHPLFRSPSTLNLHLTLSRCSPYRRYLHENSKVYKSLSTFLPQDTQPVPTPLIFWECAVGMRPMTTRWIFTSVAEHTFLPVCLAGYFQDQSVMRVSQPSNPDWLVLYKLLKSVKFTLPSLHEEPTIVHCPSSPADVIQVITAAENFEKLINDYQKLEPLLMK